MKKYKHLKFVAHWNSDGFLTGRLEYKGKMLDSPKIKEMIQQTKSIKP